MVGVRHVDVFNYAELLRLTSPQRDEAALLLLQRFMDALGRSGCGLLAIRGIPHLPSLRHALLRLAPVLAHLSPLELSQVLKNHRIGTDVSLKDPDRSVSSFTAQLNFRQHENDQDMGFADAAKALCIDSADNYRNCYLENQKHALHELGPIFRHLGKEMSNVGILVAKICDIMIPEAGLENTILEATRAKGRLIHYHSFAEQSNRQSCSHASRSKTRKQKSMQAMSTTYSDMWQDWHYDYGIFTVLTAPMFLRSIADDSTVSCAHNLNFIESNELFPDIGLKISSSGNKQAEFICAPADCLLVQAGEAAEILTGGKLCATVHCVCRPLDRDDVSRETFVVFLQPSWDKCLASPNPEGFLDAGRDLGSIVFEEEPSEIQCKVPSLHSRWRNGCTFAEFSRETTKRYYGANGSQGK